MTALASVAKDLSALVLDLDPARSDWEHLRRQLDLRCHELRARLEALSAELEARFEAKVSARATTVLRATSEDLRVLTTSSEGTRHRLYANLARSYEQLVAALDALPGEASVSTAKLSPKNIARNVFHVSGGVGAALIYHFLLTREQAVMVMAVVAGVLTSLEIGRRVSPRMNDQLMRMFASIARPHEYHRMNSSTVYAYGLLLAALLFPQPAVELGCVILAVADPAASNVGRRFGARKIYGNKSWAGTLAFVLVGALGAAAYLSLVHPDAPLLAAACIGAVAGAIAEVVSHRLDDNLTVPITVALAVSWLF